MSKFPSIIKSFNNPKVVTMLFLGFSAGVPILLIFSTLGLWLNEAGVKKSTITYFSWAALGYSFKFIWAPIIDKVPIPYLSKTFGRRRTWLLLSQIMIICAIVLMALVNPQSSVSSLSILAYGAVLLGFSSATQDIVIDAYRIECANIDMQPLLSSFYIGGYRLGMIIASAGALYLASFFGSTKESYNYSAWFYTYLCMAGVMLVGVITTLTIKEPELNNKIKYHNNTLDYVKILVFFLMIVVCFIYIFNISADIIKEYKGDLKTIFNNRHLSSFIVETLRLGIIIFIIYLISKILIKVNIISKNTISIYSEPVIDFFKKFDTKTAILLLLIVGFYRISDIVLGIIANVFYQDIGFSKIDIANASKTFGLIMTITGSFLGGILAIHFGVFKILLLGAILSSATNLLFILLSNINYPDIYMLYGVITVDNLSAGLAAAAFIAFLSKLTNIEFTAVQYAIFSSLMTLFPKILGGYSGSIVESYGYQNFFIMTTIIGLPIIYFSWKAKNYIK